MEWLLKFAEKSEDEKVKIIFHFIKFFIVSISSFMIYKYMFGDYIIQEFTFKNAVDFINSKYLFFSTISFLTSWFVFWVINLVQRKIAYYISDKLKKIFNSIFNDHFSYRITKNTISFVSILIKIRILKLKNDKIIPLKSLSVAKESLLETDKIKDESEKTYYILSSIFIFLVLEFYYYTGLYLISIFLLILSFHSFILAVFFTFSLRNSNMMIAIFQSIKNFIEHYEHHRYNKPVF